MLKKRVIPCLLLKGSGLYKSVKYKNLKYIGDPINAVRIFNEKEVDEIALFDMMASVENAEPNYSLIKDIAGECFMPLSYGGGVRSQEHIRKLIFAGVEKVVINTAAIETPQLITDSANHFGSSTIVVAIDIKKNLWGKYKVFTGRGTRDTKLDPVKWAQSMEQAGAGEILVNSIDSDGMMAGYDCEIIEQMCQSVKIPVVACGGAGSLKHIEELFQKTGVSGAAAGSLFIYQGVHRAVLINYPSRNELDLIT